MVAAVYFLDWCQTSGAAFELIFPVRRPFFVVHFVAISTWVPFLTTLEAHFFCALGAHSSPFAATWLFYL
jgi:hypothetical protein